MECIGASYCPDLAIISGGQTGADVAGLMAAKVCGLQTGGWMPRGWTTLDGPKPHYAKLFGMKEHYAKAYSPRTFLNVKETDATIRFASDFASAGERCTLKAIRGYGKPYIDVHQYYEPDPTCPYEMTPQTVAQWIREKEIRRLNIAGNSKQTSARIGPFTFDYLIRVFHYLGHEPLEEMADFYRYVVSRLSSPEERPGSP